MTDDGRKVAQRKKEEEKSRKKKKKETNSTLNDIFTVSEKITTLNFCTLWWPSGQSSQHNTDHYTLSYFTTQQKNKNKKRVGGGGGEALGGRGAGEHNNNEEMKTCIMFYKVCGIVKVSLWHAGTYPPAWHSIVGLQWQQLD